MKMLEFQSKFDYLFVRYNKYYSIIGSDKGLVLTRRQAIIWSNDGLITDT